ncbi:MAG: glycosyltransferase [Bacteroidota bacterium]
MKNKDRVRILHITNWYPSAENPHEAIWIKRQIDSIKDTFDNDVVHIEVKPKQKYRFKKGKHPGGVDFIHLSVPTKYWLIVEILTTLLLIYYLVWINNWRKYDLLNFHIAYPLLIHWHWLGKWFKKKIIVNEHYSGYHYNFHLSDLRKKKKISRIFKNELLLLTVSKSLLWDIEKFCGFSIPNKSVLPNVLPASFQYMPGVKKEKYFFMLTNFNYPKRPDVVLEAFAAFSKNAPEYKLLAGGISGNDKQLEKYQWDDDLRSRIIFLGRLSELEIVKKMNQSEAFLHCSDYETFSVVCLEALGCGVPVIASGVGGIKEYITSENGVLVAENNVSDWKESLYQFLKRKTDYEADKISRNTKEEYARESISEEYKGHLLNYLLK